ncbi:MAG: AAA family ATPase [Chloroflexota bacterium]
MANVEPAAERELAEQIRSLTETARRIEEEVGRVIVGQSEVVREVLTALLAGGHVLLEGVPGLGKTVLVRTLGQALALDFARIQFTPDLMPADIVGTNIVVEEDGRREFRFQPGPIFANLLLADEINRATPKTQSALLEAMQERTATTAGVTRPLPAPFFVLATQNPIEMEGTYPLPEAQLDRFLFKTLVRFPSADELQRIAMRTTGDSRSEVRQVAGAANVLALNALVRQVPAAEAVVQYAVRLLLATHPDQPSAPADVKRYVRYGASPRGLQSLLLAGKVRALLEGRFNVAFDDIRGVAKPALRHRLFLNFEGEAAGLTTDAIIEGILAAVSTDGQGV